VGSAGRYKILGGAILVAWGLLLARAFQVQVVDHAYWDQRAVERQGQVRSITASRGSIISSDGVAIAQSISNRSLAVDPTMVKDPAALAAALEKAGLVEAVAFRARLKKFASRRFLWVERDVVREHVLDELLDEYPSLIADAEPKRLYALGAAGGAVVGIVGREDRPHCGLEHVFADELAGRDGSMLEISDRTGERYQGLERHMLEEPVAGGDIVVSLHSQMQEIVATHLERAVAAENATGGFAILTRPRTGEILAMASAPAPDPSDPTTWSDRTLKVRPVADVFEPGSIYKIVAFAAALEANKLDLNEKIDCMNGLRKIPGGHPIRDHDPMKIVPAWEVMAHSSNIGTGVIAERVGAEGFFRMEKSLGFGLPTGVELSGEGRGRIPAPSAWSGRSLLTMAFGQEISCNGVQLAMALGAIANDGYLMRPYLVREVRSRDGITRIEPEIRRRVMSSETAAKLRQTLRRVVTDGTGKKSEIKGFPTAGKTGTAQKYVRELGRYSKERYVASFFGFAPWNDPEVLCVVVLDEPRGDIYGGNVAAPVFQQILVDVRPLLGETELAELKKLPTPEDGSALRPIPPIEDLAGAAARRLILEKGFLPRFEGDGEWVVHVEPPVGTRLLPGGVVTIHLAGERSSTAAIMPDLAGLSLRDALLRLESLDLPLEVDGAGWVLRQKPGAGTELESGLTCWIELGPDSSVAWREFREIEERTARQFAVGAYTAASSRSGKSSR